MGRISEELHLIVEAARAQGMAREIPVIVSVREGTDPGRLEAVGLVVRHRFESISALSGAIAASGVADLAALEEVDLVEFDGEMRAMEGPAAEEA